MARLTGLVMLMIGVYLTIDHAVALAPTAADSRRAGTLAFEAEPLAANEPFYLEYLAESGSVTAPDQGWSSTVEMLPGPYEVLDSSDEQIARRDRDYRARRPLFGVDLDDTDDDTDLDDTDDDTDDDDDRADAIKKDAGSADSDDEVGPSEAEGSVHFDRTQPVRGEIEPGLYATDFDVSDCHYQLWHVTRKRAWALIGEENLESGRVLVEINEIEPDLFVGSDGCGNWSRWHPLDEPLRVATDGDYWIGDLERGLWTVPLGCHWEKVVGFRGALLADVTERGIGPIDLEVDAETIGVRLRNCSHPVLLRVLGVSQISDSGRSDLGRSDSGSSADRTEDDD